MPRSAQVVVLIGTALSVLWVIAVVIGLVAGCIYLVGEINAYPTGRP